MPTGYTAKIADGISFREFVMDCARAFGACVTLRDEPGGGEAIPDEFMPSPYYAERLQYVVREIQRVRGMSAADKEAIAYTEYLADVRVIEDRRRERKDLRSKYETMLAEVEGWSPPTDDHVELKRFMLDQIRESIKFDCLKWRPSYEATPKRMTGDEWFKRRLSDLESDLEYAASAYLEEVERAKSRTKWVRALRESLDGGDE